MTYQEVLDQARTCVGPYCKACPVCNGLGCRNAIPGKDEKGISCLRQRRRAGIKNRDGQPDSGNWFQSGRIFAGQIGRSGADSENVWSSQYGAVSGID